SRCKRRGGRGNPAAPWDTLSRASLPARPLSWLLRPVMTACPPERVALLADLGESLAQLRGLDAGAIPGMREALQRHGQLTAGAAYPPRDRPNSLELVDGFIRLRAARELGWAELRVRVLGVETTQAKAAMRLLNDGRGLCELEEAWLVRSLYR